jgi:hypothetical protein
VYSVSRPIAALVGFLYAVLLACVAFGFVGGRDGWLSSFHISLGGLLLIPFAAVAWAWRRRSMLVAATLIAALADLILLLATLREGFEYVGHSFAAVPLLVIAWVGLWLLWQIVVIMPLLCGTVHT